MAPPARASPAISVVIPAFNEEEGIAATVAGAAAIPGVAEVIVVDDGSADATAARAAQAGAAVVTVPHRGKGQALRQGIALAGGDLVLLLDADLGASARSAAALVAPVRSGEADMAIAVLPAPGRRPGLGIALRTARVCLWLLTGHWFAAPLSGQRCLTADLACTLPWARGFAAEVAATADALALGARVVEVAVDLQHAPTSRTLRGFMHRGRQFVAVLAAFLPRALYPISPAARPAPGRRIMLALVVWGALIALGTRLLPWLGAVAGIGALAIAATVVSLALVSAAGIIRPNYAGREIPAAGGLAFVVGPWLAWAATAWRASSSNLSDLRSPANISLCAAAGITLMSCAGLADDAWGDRSVSGLRGHLGRLLRGRLTTGGIKALAGLVVGLGTGWAMVDISPHESWSAIGRVGLMLVNGLLIALSANLINLLDLRPGRAFKGFLFLTAILALAEGPDLPGTRYIIVPVGLFALTFAPLDFGGRAMMGDVGANALGAAAGIALALALPLWAKLCAAACLVGLHLYSETHSIGDLIGRTPGLRWLDRLGRPGGDAS